MCYQTLYTGIMELQHTYILPLDEPAIGQYALPGCAQSGLELVAGSLYTFEQASGAARRTRFYKRYSSFLRGYRK